MDVAVCVGGGGVAVEFRARGALTTTITVLTPPCFLYRPRMNNAKTSDCLKSAHAQSAPSPPAAWWERELVQGVFGVRWGGVFTLAASDENH